MKKLLILGTIAATAVLLGSCTNDDATLTKSEILKGINVTIEQSEFFSDTRATYVVDSSRGFVSSWAEGDVIGIYPLGGDQVAFPISDGEGSSTARFDGGSWALRSNVKYSAYYPFSKSNYTVPETEIPVSYKGQSQSGNNSTAGLFKYDYLVATATEPDNDGCVDLTMKHIASFARFVITVPDEKKFTKIELSANEDVFVSEGTIDLTQNEIRITPTKMESLLCVMLDDFTPIRANETLTVYCMIPPCDLTNTSIKLNLYTDTGDIYSASITMGELNAGKSYSYSASVEMLCEASLQAIDLGLPSGTLWANMNVGAANVLDYGSIIWWGYPLSSYSSFYDNGKIYHSITGTEFDTAKTLWGDDWRMPRMEQLEELYYECDKQWYSSYLGSGVAGVVFVGPNGNSIFLPASGQIDYGAVNGSVNVNRNISGGYWSGDICPYLSQDYIGILYFREGVPNSIQAYWYRTFEGSVRPVWDGTHDYIYQNIYRCPNCGYSVAYEVPECPDCFTLWDEFRYY